jgi:serine/threonine protein kinase
LEHYHHTIDVNVCGLIVSEIASALQFMKSRNLVHGDLKPENVLIDITEERLTVKLCDFGTCQFSLPGTVLSSVYVGTSGFHSPEVWLTPESYWFVFSLVISSPCPPSFLFLSPYAADIFGLGCIALEIIIEEVDPCLPLPRPQRSQFDFTKIWMSSYGERDDCALFITKINEAISSVRLLIQVSILALILLLRSPCSTIGIIDSAFPT